MKDVLTQVWLAFAGLMTSTKFWTAVVGMTATGLAAHHIILPPDMAQYIAAGFGLVLGGQALAGHGKDVALINASHQLHMAEHYPQLHGALMTMQKPQVKRFIHNTDKDTYVLDLDDGSELDITDFLAKAGLIVLKPTPLTVVPKKPEGGFVRIGLMAILLACVATICTACAWWSSSGKTKAIAGGKAAGACVLSEVEKYASSVLGDLEKLDYDKALSDFKAKENLSQDAVNCLVKTVVAVLTAQPTGGASTSAPTPAVLHAKEYLAAHGDAK